MEDFIYQKDKAPCGITVEEIYGADEKSPKVWKLFAMQIFSEAEGDYRAIEHFENGAPVLDGMPQRISVSHTSHFLAVASLPKTPDNDLAEVNPRTAMGIDIERADRAQAVKVADRFLSPEEFKLLPPVGEGSDIPEKTVEAYVLAWTCKEALYKSIMGTAPDWKDDYCIKLLPVVADTMAKATPDKFGKGSVRLSDGKTMEMALSSWRDNGHILTLAFSPKIARYHTKAEQA